MNDKSDTPWKDYRELKEYQALAVSILNEKGSSKKETYDELIDVIKRATKERINPQNSKELKIEYSELLNNTVKVLLDYSQGDKIALLTQAVKHDISFLKTITDWNLEKANHQKATRKNIETLLKLSKKEGDKILYREIQKTFIESSLLLGVPRPEIKEYCIGNKINYLILKNNKIIVKDNSY